MGLFSYFRPPQQPSGSAAVAKERLQIIVSHERGVGRRRGPDYLPELKKDLLTVVRKYMPVDQDQVKVHLDRKGDCEILELNITLLDDTDQDKVDDLS